MTLDADGGVTVSDEVIVLMLVFVIVASSIGLALAIWIEKVNKGAT